VEEAADLGRELSFHHLGARIGRRSESSRIYAGRPVDGKINLAEVGEGIIDGALDFVSAVKVGLENENFVALGAQSRQPFQYLALCF
jgi:hypothetical protein